MVKAILFDADGVLVDACELHFIALNRALATMGWSISRSEHLATYNGLPTHKKLNLLSETKGFPEDWHGAVHGLKQDFTRQAIDECIDCAPEKRELLHRLRGLGLKIAVCSNSLHSTLEQMLKATGIHDLVDIVLGNDDVAAPKPSPEIYLLAAKKLGVHIGDCVVVEDSPVGLQSAQAAGPLHIVEVEGPRDVDARLVSRIMDPIKEAA